LVEKILGTRRLTTKGQVTIPSEAREKFHMNIGDLIVFIEVDGKLFLRKS